MSPGTPTTPDLRVVVVGSSIGTWSRPVRSDAFTPGNYGEMLEVRLRQTGISTQVINTSGWWLMIDRVFSEVEERVLHYSPHVVIINVGFLEAQPTLLPTSITKWLFTWKPNGARPAMLVRRLLAPVVDLIYRRVHPRLLRVLPAPSRRSPRRFRRELRRLVAVIRKDRRALVVLLNASPPGPAVEQVLPGSGERVIAFNSIQDDVSATVDDCVVVDTHSMVRRLGHEAVMPDSIHYNAAGHDAVAAAIANEITRWLSAQEQAPQPARGRDHEETRS